MILLRGPATALDRQGPELIRALRRDPAVTTLSPWDRGTVQRLRPSPRRAILIVDFHVGIDQAVNETVPKLNRTLEAKIQPPVRATQTGFATLSRAIQDESISATERGELIALPILLIVLLLVFRSPVAAAIPLAFGAVTVLASRGLLSILTDWFGVDAFALTVCTMMGLALGVDYALLMVSRFREELAERGRAARGRLGDPTHRRADHRLRRQHADALDAGRLLRRPRLAARLAGGDAGPRRRPQRPRRRRCSARRC